MKTDTIFRLGAVLVCSLFFSCNGLLENINNYDTSNESAQTDSSKKIVIISDIHLGDKRGQEQGYCWITDGLPLLEHFLDSIALESANVGTLVINGDFFDEWAVPMDHVPFIDIYGNPTDKEEDFFEVLVRDNKIVFDALRRVKDAGIELVYIPGNHDMSTTAEDFDKYLPGLFTQARDVAGLGHFTPPGMPEVLIEHGHRYDLSNMPDPYSHPGSLLPIGYLIARYASSVESFEYNSGKATVKESEWSTEGLIDPTDPTVQRIWNELLEEKGLEIDAHFERHLPLVKIGYDLFMQMAVETKCANCILEPFYGILEDIEWALITRVKHFSTIEQNLEALLCDIILPAPLPRRVKLYTAISYLNETTSIYANAFKPENIQKRMKENGCPEEETIFSAMLAGGLGSILTEKIPPYLFNSRIDPKRVLIFAHNHSPSVQKRINDKEEECIYANCGTWVDKEWTSIGNHIHTYIELERNGNQYTITLKEHGLPSPLMQQSITL